MPIRCLTALGIVAALAVAHAQEARPSDWKLEVVPLAAPAAGLAGQPQLTVSSRGTLLSWISREGGRASLKFAERTATGWTPAKTVASGDNWFVNWADVPSVLRLPNGHIVGHWLQKSGPGTYAYDVRLAYSTDNGRTFSPSFTPHHDGTKTEHGFASLFAVGDGFGAVWLDGRETRSAGHDSGNHTGGGAMTLRYAAFDGRGKQIADAPIDVRVCDCCPTTAVMTADGPIVAFRDRSEKEIRDIHVSRLENGAWTASKAVAADNWEISGCPVNGPTLSARGRDVVAAWFSGADNQPRAFVAFSSDAGRTFAPAIRVDDNGTLGRVDVELLPDGAAAVAWVEYANRVAEFRVRRVDRQGTRSAPVTIAKISSERASGYQRLALHRDELAFAWLEGAGAGQSTLKTAVAKLPGRTR